MTSNAKSNSNGTSESESKDEEKDQHRTTTPIPIPILSSKQASVSKIKQHQQQQHNNHNPNQQPTLTPTPIRDTSIRSPNPNGQYTNTNTASSSMQLNLQLQYQSMNMNMNMNMFGSPGNSIFLSPYLPSTPPDPNVNANVNVAHAKTIPSLVKTENENESSGVVGNNAVVRNNASISIHKKYTHSAPAASTATATATVTAAVHKPSHLATTNGNGNGGGGGRGTGGITPTNFATDFGKTDVNNNEEEKHNNMGMSAHSLNFDSNNVLPWLSPKAYELFSPGGLGGLTAGITPGNNNRTLTPSRLNLSLESIGGMGMGMGGSSKLLLAGGNENALSLPFEGGRSTTTTGGGGGSAKIAKRSAKISVSPLQRKTSKQLAAATAVSMAKNKSTVGRSTSVGSMNIHATMTIPMNMSMTNGSGTCTPLIKEPNTPINFHDVFASPKQSHTGSNMGINGHGLPSFQGRGGHEIPTIGVPGSNISSNLEDEDMNILLKLAETTPRKHGSEGKALENTRMFHKAIAGGVAFAYPAVEPLYNMNDGMGVNMNMGSIGMGHDVNGHNEGQGQSQGLHEHHGLHPNPHGHSHPIPPSSLHLPIIGHKSSSSSSGTGSGTTKNNSLLLKGKSSKDRKGSTGSKKTSKKRKSSGSKSSSARASASANSNAGTSSSAAPIYHPASSHPMPGRMPHHPAPGAEPGTVAGTGVAPGPTAAGYYPPPYGIHPPAGPGLGAAATGTVHPAIHPHPHAGHGHPHPHGHPHAPYPYPYPPGSGSSPPGHGHVSGHPPPPHYMYPGGDAAGAGAGGKSRTKKKLGSTSTKGSKTNNKRPRPSPISKQSQNNNNGNISNSSGATTANTNTKSNTKKRKNNLAKGRGPGKKRAGANHSSITPIDKRKAAATISAINKQSGKKNDKAASLAAAVLRGVTMRPSGKWQAQLYFAGKSRYIGVFDSREKAALAYEIAREHLQNKSGSSAGKDTEAHVNAARKAAFEGVNENDPRLS
uniref:AP2/ERF domain-containing protein n=1 Tax=Chaetoceros debilis TaxID=122233 RepID=A0A7S3VE89_9STRA